ncbi:hypothetical protein BT69DRAFT_1254501, partial [Atractiella rhizophila]
SLLVLPYRPNHIALFAFIYSESPTKEEGRSDCTPHIPNKGNCTTNSFTYSPKSEFSDLHNTGVGRRNHGAE